MLFSSLFFYRLGRFPFTFIVKLFFRVLSSFILKTCPFKSVTESCKIISSHHSFSFLIFPVLVFPSVSSRFPQYSVWRWTIFFYEIWKTFSWSGAAW
jgi:hypothetical protein